MVAPWIESVEKLEDMMDEYIQLQRKRAMHLNSVSSKFRPDRDRWELCARVLARRDVVDRLSVPW